MLAVHLENGRVTTRNTRVPKRPPGFALIRLLSGGICNTDLELQRGYSGFSGTPGHEFVGEVVSADNPNLLARRVVGEINLACGACNWCRAGVRGRCCRSRQPTGVSARTPRAVAGAEPGGVPAAGFQDEQRASRPIVAR